MYAYNAIRYEVHDRIQRYEQEAAAERAARQYRAGRHGGRAVVRRAAAVVERVFGQGQDARAASRG
jgi:hypothetical protein